MADKEILKATQKEDGKVEMAFSGTAAELISVIVKTTRQLLGYLDEEERSAFASLLISALAGRSTGGQADD